jgi:hypothetical protein
MNFWNRFSHLRNLLVAVVVALLTLAITAQAVQTITTANASIIGYNLAAGAFGPAITPVANQSVFVQCNQILAGFRGVGHVSLLRIPATFLEWVGLESPAGAAITSGFSAVNGTHIVYCDFSHTVDIEVNTADTFRIHNSHASAAAGNITLMW